MTATTQEVEKTAQEAPKTAEVNLAAMRRQLEAERAEKAQMQQKLMEFERLTKVQPKVDNDDEESNEPYIDSRTLKKKLSRLEESIDEKIERKAEEKARALMDEEKRASYLKQNADFDKIMAPDIIQKFADKHPDVAEAILRMPDGFERQRLVYANIKALGIHKPPEPKESIQATIDKNRRNPYYSPSGPGTAPYAATGDFSPVGQKSAYDKLQQLKANLRLG